MFRGGIAEVAHSRNFGKLADCSIIVAQVAILLRVVELPPWVSVTAAQILPSLQDQCGNCEKNRLLDRGVPNSSLQPPFAAFEEGFGAKSQ